MNISRHLRVWHLVVSTVGPLLICAQLQLPSELLHPRYSMGEKMVKLNDGVDYQTGKIHSRNTADQEWHAFTDRSDVGIYENDKWKEKKTALPRIGTMLTVIKESNEGVEVTQGGSKLGWVKKAELVLWPHPLVKYGSEAVDLKAFIVNTVDKAFTEKIGKDPTLKAFYQIYDGPSSNKVLDTKQIYQILFAYKYDDAQGRYLLSNNYKLDGDGQILGWVDQNRVKIWDTALALEPNWDNSAMDERRKNSQFIAQVFKDHNDATRYYGGDYKVKPLNQLDPVILEKDKTNVSILHESGRFSGIIPRFPFLSQASNDAVIECGAIGKMNVANTGAIKGTSDVEFGLLRKKLERAQENQGKVNIVFVVDATIGMQKHFKSTLLPAVQALIANTASEKRSNLRFGMVAYADGDCGSSVDNVLVKRIKLTNDLDQFSKFASATQVNTSIDGDVLVASRFGLLSALNDLGMNEDETNIIFHLGRTMDVGSDMVRSFSCTQIPFVDDGDLINAFFNKRPAIISFQTAWKNGIGYKGFEDEMQVLMEKVASKINDSEKERFINYAPGQETQTEVIRKKGYTEIENAPTLMRIYYPDRSQAESELSPEVLVQLIGEAYGEANKKGETELNIRAKLFNDDQTLGKAFTDFSSEAVIALSKANLTTEEMLLLAKERVHTFQLANTFLKNKDAQYPTYRLVLFMKQGSVDALRDLFARVENASDSEDAAGQRDILKSALEKYAKSILNIEDMDQKVDISRLRSQITGVGDHVGGSTSLLSRLSKLDDIENLSDMEVQNYFREIKRSGREFNDKVINVKGGYPFVYTAGIGERDKELKFYWIPMEYLF
ncbi:MAG: hypothetical protein IPI00_07030 [Flavobacteriales bacterium]|nr:hypothetical protein [Flavobacteriales bacterium]MBK6943708.1 hypothetical protein [Flavobacteriales bacterium]MBK7239920.1 hypothetical protein [Flavobacteriales bacterium]MBK9535760.1 hypothetical protein [Flavobacteriales bacterium]MBP9138762.1 hypothetical protein [Flavobacteriales bacterium]